jgi:uncharacterized protein (TIGR00255 family)
LEPAVRASLGARFRRGSFSVTLQLSRTDQALPLKVNRAALDALLKLIGELGTPAHIAPARLDGLLALKGVIEGTEAVEDETARTARDGALRASFDHVLEALAGARQEEGGRLGMMLSAALSEIERLSAAAAASAAARPEAMRARLKAQIAVLLEAGAPLSEERLAQELALLAVKADIREEIDRLRAHVAAARQLLNEGGPVGRRLDFLAQEFNREANTLCSKAGDVALTTTGLALKAVIDQFREQVQNIE